MSSIAYQLELSIAAAAVAAGSVIVTLLSRRSTAQIAEGYDHPRQRTQPSLHLQSVLLVRTTPTRADEVLLPPTKLGVGALAGLAYLLAISFSIKLWLDGTCEMDGLCLQDMLRALAALFLGIACEAEAGGAPPVGSPPRSAWLWRARALLRLVGAAAVTVGHLRETGEPSIEHAVLGGATAILGAGFALTVCQGPPPLEPIMVPPPPMRTAWLIPKLLYFFWLPVVRSFVNIATGRPEEPLAISDLPSLEPSIAAAACWQKGAVGRARREAAHEAHRMGQAGQVASGPKRGGSLMPEMWRVVWADAALQFGWCMLVLVFEYAAPGGMLGLIGYISSDSKESIPPRAIAFGAMVAMGPLTLNVCHGQANACGWRFGTKLRAYLTRAICEKALRYDASATDLSVGQLSNLLAVDTQNIYNFAGMSAWLWLEGMQLVCTLVALYLILGVAAMGGLAVCLFAFPLNSIVMRRVKARVRLPTNPAPIAPSHPIPNATPSDHTILSDVHLITSRYPSHLTPLLVMRHPTPPILLLLQILQERLMRQKDERMGLITEAIGAIRTIKLHGWEGEFESRIAAKREREVATLLSFQKLNAITSTMWLTTPTTAGLASFLIKSQLIAPYTITAAEGFTSLTLFQLLSVSLTFLPYVINSAIQANVGLRRISRFLTLKDVDGRTTSSAELPLEHGAGQMLTASFAWSSPPPEKTTKPAKLEAAARKGTRSARRAKVESCAAEGGTAPLLAPTPAALDAVRGAAAPTAAPDAAPDAEHAIAIPLTLKNITLKISPGKLTLIVGPTGCGKSSLLAALLGDCPRIDGAVSLEGRVSYCPQRAWVANATLRDNITFGAANSPPPPGFRSYPTHPYRMPHPLPSHPSISYAAPARDAGRPFDQSRYDAVLHACALQNDLLLLPAGDMTEIGERGVNLSGGQQQRVNLARACYADSDVILLDDVLSAVDAHVSAHIVDNCLRGLLEGRTRVLVTHSVALTIAHADHVVVMEGGRVVASGPPTSSLPQIQALAAQATRTSQPGMARRDPYPEGSNQLPSHPCRVGPGPTGNTV